jgi:hypothetical protein
MGYIKEPKGVNFVVDPKPLTEQDRKMISEVIAHYKATGRKKGHTMTKKLSRRAKSKKAIH